MRLRYLISDSSDLTPDYLSRALQDFQSRVLPRLAQLWNYYIGKQAITKKQPTDIGKPCNRSMFNYCERIVNNYNGYITGIPISYSNDEFEDIMDIINYNDVTQEDTEYLKQALIYGRAFECNYIDEEGKQRFKLFSTKECLPVYLNTIEEPLQYVIRFYQESLLENLPGMDNYIVEVYGPNDIKRYRSAPGFASFELIEQRPHFFGQCPVTVFSLNEDEESCFAQIMSLQDTYNQMASAGVDDTLAWADAYLVIKGAIADGDDLRAMKETRTMQFPQNDGDAKYLTKDTSPVQLMENLKNINDQIYSIAGCPDFTNETFMSKSGEALKYKLVGLEFISSNIEAHMRKALQRRIENICAILSLTDTEDLWRDVDIRFTRNLPNSLSPTTVQELMSYQGLVSKKTLLELVPFVKDPDEELVRLREEQQSEIDSFEFGHNLEGEYEQLDSEATPITR